MPEASSSHQKTLTATQSQAGPAIKLRKLTEHASPGWDFAVHASGYGKLLGAVHADGACPRGTPVTVRTRRRRLECTPAMPVSSCSCFLLFHLPLAYLVVHPPPSSSPSFLFRLVVRLCWYSGWFI